MIKYPKSQARIPEWWCFLYDDADSKAIGIVGNKITVLPLYDALQITRDIDPYMLELVDVLSK